MLVMSYHEKIKLITILSPHEFYFKFSGESWETHNSDVYRKIKATEKQIARIKHQKVYHQKVEKEEVYACFNEKRKNWVRGRVLQILKNGEYRVFLIDYGIFLHFRNVCYLPRELKTEFNHIRRGALSLKSAKEAHQWSDEILAECKKVNESRDNLEITYVPLYSGEQSLVGDLFIRNKAEGYSLTKKLIALGCVSECSTFTEILNVLKQHQAYFDGSSLSKKRIEISQQSNVLQDIGSNLLVFGQDLKLPWLNIFESKLHHIIRDQISKNCQSLSPTQSHVWPQINDGKSTVVISSDFNGLTNSYLAPLINRLVRDSNHGRNVRTANSMGPIALVFAADSEKVNEIAGECKKFQMTLNISIVTATGHCDDKKGDLLSGCDFLITTPPAFARLTKDVAISIINDNGRLKHVVFDRFHQLTSKYDQLVVSNFKFFMKTVPRPQFVMTSSSLTNLLRFKMIRSKEFVICVEDNDFEIASYAGMKLSIEILSKRDSDVLREILAKEYLNHDTRKTIIVASEDKICNYLESQLSIDGMKFINCCNNVNAASQWNDAKDVLLLSDSMLELANVQSAENLIHFDLPKECEHFSKRFQVLRKSVLEKLTVNASTVQLTTKILLCDENAEQLIRMMSFISLQNQSTPLKGILENIHASREKIKCQQNVLLCERLLQRGKCDKIYTCSLRHTLSDKDKAMNHLPPAKSLIKFDLISVENPTSFIIQIREHFENSKWISRDASNKVIQQRLNEMQTFCQKKENVLKANEGKISEIYAKFDVASNTWRRGRIIQRDLNSSLIVKLFLIDIGIVQLSRETALQKLPDEFSKIDPLVCKLKIMDLLPLDMEDQYSDQATDNLRQLLSKVHKSAFFLCKVEASLGDMIFAKSFDSKLVKKSFKFQLTNAHSKLKISTIDESVSRNILALILDRESGMTKEPPKSDKRVFSQVKLKEESECNTENCWKKLTCGKSYKVKVAHYASPYSFIVVVQDNGSNLILKSGLERIENSLVKDNLNDFDAGKICIYREEEKTYRAIILSSGEDQEILLVDYGKVRRTEQKNLFEVPSELLNLQFQAIHCSLMGVRPKYKMKMWPKMQRDAVEKLISEGFTEMLAMNVDAKNKTNFAKIGMSCYEVLLFNEHDRLDKIAVGRKIADADETVDNLNFDMSSQDEEEDGEELNEQDLIENTYDDFFSVNVGKDLESLLRVSEDDENKNGKEIEALEDKSAKTLRETDSSELSSSKILPDTLENLYKLSSIEWRQNEFMIYMLVTAKDCESYNLSITEYSLDVILKQNGGKIERSIIRFFGRIDVELCSHEMTGLNVVIRLVKKSLNIWPRLTDERLRVSHIKFSNERVPLNFKSEETTFVYDTNYKFRPPGDSDIDDPSSDAEFKISSSDEEF